jgi:hypothetical protein
VVALDEMMRRVSITSDDVARWKAQGLGLGEGAHYKPWIDVRCFSSKGRMSRRLGVTTGRVHHLFSDNESCFFLMEDYAADVVDIREQFPLFPESATQRVASSLGVRHPSYPQSRTPIVMTTDFLLTRIDKAGKRSLVAFSIKSADDLRGRSQKSVLTKLEIERRHWLVRGVPWYLFTNAEFDKTVIDNLEWLSYFIVEHDVDRDAFKAQLPQCVWRPSLRHHEQLLPQPAMRWIHRLIVIPLHACAERCYRYGRREHPYGQTGLTVAREARLHCRD